MACDRQCFSLLKAMQRDVMQSLNSLVPSTMPYNVMNQLNHFLNTLKELINTIFRKDYTF